MRVVSPEKPGAEVGVHDLQAGLMPGAVSGESIGELGEARVMGRRRFPKEKHCDGR